MEANKQFKKNFSIIFAMMVSSLSSTSNAIDIQIDAAMEPEQSTIVIDVNGDDDSLNNQKLDMFVEAQDGSKANYFAIDEENLVLSETPVYRIYVPRQLADLGITFDTYASSGIIIKIANYILASDYVQAVPGIPEIVLEPQIVTAKM